MANFKFEFFQVKENKESILSFSEALTNLKSLPYDQRSQLIDSKRYALSMCKDENEHLASYVFTKIRMTNIPDKTNITTGQRTSLDLLDDEGLGEDVVLTYDSNLNIVMIQSNIYSMSESAIQKYIHKLFLDVSFSFLPIVKPNAFEKFLNLTTLKKLRLKIAAPSDLSFMNHSKLSANEKNCIESMSSVPFIDVTISTGRSNTSLIGRMVNIFKFYVNESRNSDADYIQKLEATGSDEEHEKPYTIDLLNDRLIASYELKDSGRTIPPEKLMIIAKKVYEENYEELRKYGPTQNN